MSALTAFMLLMSVVVVASVIMAWNGYKSFKWSDAIGLISAIAALIAALYTAHQVELTRGELELARQQYNDDRPIVRITAVGIGKNNLRAVLDSGVVEFSPTDLSKVDVTVRLQNLGKRAANNVTLGAKILVPGRGNIIDTAILKNLSVQEAAVSRNQDVPVTTAIREFLTAHDLSSFPTRLTIWISSYADGSTPYNFNSNDTGNGTVISFEGENKDGEE